MLVAPQGVNKEVVETGLRRASGLLSYPQKPYTRDLETIYPISWISPTELAGRFIPAHRLTRQPLLGVGSLTWVRPRRFVMTSASGARSRG